MQPPLGRDSTFHAAASAARHEGEDGVVGASAPAEREMGGWSVGRGEVLDGWPVRRWVAVLTCGRVVVSMLVGGGGEGGG